MQIRHFAWMVSLAVVSISNLGRAEFPRIRLEPVMQALDLTFRLGMATDEAGLAALPGSYEGLLVTGEQASIAEIVSDEVLLAMPLVALHGDDSRCRGTLKDYQPQEGEARESPFAVLAELKQKQS